MFKVCHQLCYGFENLMSSWRVWISFSKLLWGNVFLKNHAKSKVFQNTPSTMPFLNIFFQFEQNFDIFRPQSFRSFDQALTSPSGVQRRIYTTSAEREFDGMGLDGISKVSFNFLYTSWVYRSCIYLLIYVIKFCHQHSYGFQNLISSWRVWIWFLKLLWVNVFFKNHAISKVFQNTPRYTPFLNIFFQF